MPLDRLMKFKVKELADWLVNRVGANAIIIDIKDDSGRVTFTNELPLAKRMGHGYVGRMRKIVKVLHKHDVYVIGRLVCFKDQFLPRVRAQTGVRDRRTGKLWRDRKNRVWIDPYSRLAHKFIADVALAAQKIGFDEIQLDYVRFSVDPESKHATYANRKGRAKRYEAIAGLLHEVDSAISIPLSVDVFGLTAYRKGDKNGLGQSIEHLAPYIDAISPMLYLANWHQSVYKNANPATVRYRVEDAVRKIRERLPDEVVIRPLLQAFPFRAERLYGPSFIKDQIDAAEGAGASGYLFWNPNGTYVPVSVVWERVEAKKNAQARNTSKSRRGPSPKP
jgi:hypothetical protein